VQGCFKIGFVLAGVGLRERDIHGVEGTLLMYIINRWSAIDKWIDINLEKLKKSDFAPQLFMQFFTKYELEYIKRKVRSGR